MKRLVLMVVMASLLAIVAVSPTGAARKPHPRVVCVTQWEPPQSADRFRPHACDFHERGEPYAHAWIQVVRRLHWRYWTHRRALGHGKLYINSYGPAPARVKLSRARQRCGRKVFTKARFKVRAAGDTFRYSIRLDKCTR